MYFCIRSSIRPLLKKCKRMSRECHNHKSHPFPYTKRKREETQTNTRKTNKRAKSTQTSYLFPKQGDRGAEKTTKHNGNMQDKTRFKSPRRINHKPTQSKSNTGITALERSVVYTTVVSFKVQYLWYSFH